jgi:formylglycine-generating enzyme required for sulfatase activity
MTKAFQRFLCLSLVLSLSLAACSALSATSAPTAIPLSTATLPATNTPAPPTSTVIPTASLSGPVVGTSMLWTDGDKLVYVPAGEFTMGIADGQDNPSHSVKLSEFWINQTEVTNRMYRTCVTTGVCTLPLDDQAANNVLGNQAPDQPVVAVTWDQAQSYCQWAGGDLPSEAQWEKAARGPDSNLYPWGAADPNCNLANFKGCLGKPSQAVSYTSGGSFYQALDMAGNVSEWVHDWYDPNYYSNSPQQDPTGPDNGDKRVVRGGSFQSEASEIASSARDSLTPTKYRTDLGFRCAVKTPQYFAPYCQTSAYVAGQPGEGAAETSTCVSPMIDLRGTYCESGKGVTSFTSDIPIQSVTSDILDCIDVGKNTVHCTGQPDSTGQVTVCAQGCEQVPTPSTPPQLNCLPGYIASTAEKTQCDFSTGADIRGICPSGMACTSPIDQNGNCPPGLYFDQNLNACVSATEVSNQCLPGFDYNSQLQCCQVQGASQYPGCSLGEYYNTLLGCAFLASQPAETGCVTFDLDTATCSVKQAVCSEIKNQVKCDHTPGCKYFFTSQNPRQGECRTYP